MEELKKEILKEYANNRIDKGQEIFELEDLKLLLDMLDTTTLGDILSDIKSTTHTDF